MQTFTLLLFLTVCGLTVLLHSQSTAVNKHR